MHMYIRPAQPDTDIPAITRLVNTYEPYPLTEQDVGRWFTYSSLGRITHRLVSTDADGNVSGYSGLVHESWTPPGEFIAWLIVDPAQRRQGTGRALWEASSGFLQRAGARSLISEVLDNDPVGLGFAQRRGFEILRHEFESALDLKNWQEPAWADVIPKLEAEGIRFCSLADFEERPKNYRKLFELNSAVELDIPGARGYFDYAEFTERILQAPWFRPAGQLLAVDGDTWAGMTGIGLNTDTREARHTITGVLPAYRGRKIAQALKILAVRYARQHGAMMFRTSNDSRNAPMLAINRKMGFQPCPGKYFLIKEM